MESNGKSRLLFGSLNKLDKIGMVCIGSCTLGYLENERSIELFCGFGDTLNNLHIVDVESADGVAALISVLKHLSCCY